VALAVSEIALQARYQAWQPVARNDANRGDSTIDQESLRNQNVILAEPDQRLGAPEYLTHTRRHVSFITMRRATRTLVKCQM
jgi:hypothetical protein